MTWLKMKWAVAKRKPCFWASLLLAGLTFAIIFYRPAPIEKGERSDFHIRVLSLLLEFVGIWTVWDDLRSASSTYGKETFLQSYANWFKALFGRSRSVLGGACASSQAKVSAGPLKSRWPIDASLSIDERVRRLEANYIDMDKDVDSAGIRLNTLARELEDSLKKEAQQREQQRREHERQLAEAMAGNVGKLGFGILWLAIGVALSTMSQEFANLGFRL